MRRFFAGLAVLVIALVLCVLGALAALYRPDLPIEDLAAQYGDDRSAYAEAPDGVIVHYRDEGPSNGRTLVLVHGYASSLHTWEPWVAELRERYRLVSLDLPGHGLTVTPNDFAFDGDTFAEAIDAVAKAARLDEFTIVGHSMGGEAAWTYALARPDAVQALVLIGASGRPEGLSKTAPSPVFALLRSPIAPLVRNLDLTALTRNGLLASYVDPQFVTDDLVARYVDLSRAPGHRAAMLQMMTDASARRLADDATLATIRRPALVLHGERDALVLVEGGRAFARGLPDATLVTYPDVGHFPHEERVADSALALVTFLETKLKPVAPVGAPLAMALP
jgi:pimeloyl-ACP methyl ester carboxylesterase